MGPRPILLGSGEPIIPSADARIGQMRVDTARYFGYTGGTIDTSDDQEK